jgi:hypothetical protein
MAEALQFIGLSESDRVDALRLLKLAKGDQVELRIKRDIGDDLTVFLPSEATSLIETLLTRLAQGRRVAILTEDQELSANEAAGLLGISPLLVVHRMNIGDLPFRYVGKRRRAALKDVLALKSRIDAQREAMEALAEDAEDLQQRYGV